MWYKKSWGRAWKNGCTQERQLLVTLLKDIKKRPISMKHALKANLCRIVRKQSKSQGEAQLDSECAPKNKTWKCCTKLNLYIEEVYVDKPRHSFRVRRCHRRVPTARGTTFPGDV